MQFSVEFPSVAYREGPAGVKRLAKAIEDLGYDELDMFDHVLMGYPTPSRNAPIYPPQMPIMEALMTLSFAAAVTESIGLGTEVLVLPQRQPALVAKQISTLDTLSGGRVRLGVGVGWQASEYEALNEEFHNRGRRMDEAIGLMRTYWQQERVDFDGKYYRADAMAMEPKPPQGSSLPIWVGGNSPQALKRAGRLGNGWLATAFLDNDKAKRAITTVTEEAESAGRDPNTFGLQSMLDIPPRGDSGKAFYADEDQVAERALQVAEQGFNWTAINTTAMFQAGARSVDALIELLGRLHSRLRAEVG